MPGQYPVGPGPAGGNPLPGWKKKSDKKKAESAPPNFFQDGEVLSNEGNQLIVGTNDGRTLTLSVLPRTVWQKDQKPAARTDVRPPMVVHLEAIEDDEANLAAVTVNVTAEKQLKTRPEPDPATAAAENTEAANTQATDPTGLGQPPDAPGRPILRRGKPKTRADSDQEDTSASDSGSAAPAGSGPVQPVQKKEVNEFTIDEPTPTAQLSSGTPTLVTQAMSWVDTYAKGLPNYFCDQLTTRYMAENRPENWQPQDVVTAKLVYNEGREEYRDITVGGKRTNKSMMEIGGSTSTGEFAATLRDVFWPETKTHFQFNRSSSLGSTPVAVYDFTVDLPHSHWTIKIGGQVLRPAYSGKVWIEKNTAVVRKIEMQADNIPQNYPLRSIFWSVGYDPVRLETREFLLPTVAVNQYCSRKAGSCFKNDVEWRNYHKYAGESSITYQ